MTDGTSQEVWAPGDRALWTRRPEGWNDPFGLVPEVEVLRVTRSRVVVRVPLRIRGASTTRVVKPESLIRKVPSESDGGATHV